MSAIARAATSATPRHAASRRPMIVQYLKFLPVRFRLLAEPFELFLAVAALLSGASVLFGASRPVALVGQVSPWLLRSWGGALCVGGALTLVSRSLMATADCHDALETAARVEKLGMILFSTTAAMYGAASLAVDGSGLATGPLILGWSAACATRAWIITQEWKAYEAARGLRRDAELEG